ncbi:ATP-binding protein [Paenarthrobacter sp. AB444]|uniref:ATP-binding protein n=1 Tax=Paenarthrobacter sp. AB444 TaxID=3025681 RepID=UPI0023668E1D|nr:ATP-binding protein [Paenarthrobacter sp. AB444]MDD7835814.1 ATP-binding protein [Paenarthrobacter sp. AB444]
MLPDPWLDEDHVTARLGSPHFPDRAQLLELVLSTVRSPSTTGIVVAGEKGSGKSHLLLSLKAGLPETMDVRTFAGSLDATKYGVLAQGVPGAAPRPGVSATAASSYYSPAHRPDAAMDEGPMPGLHVLRALTSTLGPASYVYSAPALRRRSKRHDLSSKPQLVLLVDDIHYVDPASLGVLLQLIPGFGAKLVATADSRRPLPQDLYQLWEDGFMEQYLLPPFTLTEAHAVCVSLLGGKVQQRASSLLAAMSGFNVAVLCLAVEDARRAGLLVRREGYWTIDTRAHCYWPGVVEHVQADNEVRPAEERLALELVALAEPVAFEILERHCGQKAVENLLADRRIRLMPGWRPMVRMGSWLWGEATRLAVPRSRSLALHQQIEEPGLTRETAPSMLRWMTWTLDCGLDLADELLLAAAPVADRPSTAELVLQAAAAVKGADHVEEAGMIRARALIAEGRIAEATPVLRQLAVAGPDEVKLDAGHRLMALELLGAVRADLPAGEVADDPAGRIAADVREAERLLLSGAATQALVRSTQAMKAVGNDPAMETFRAGVLLRHVICLRHNLGWNAMGPLLDDPAHDIPRPVAECSEVARAYVQLSQGFARAARVTLEEVLAELSDAGLPPVRSFAQAMLAYCEALSGDPAAALARAKQGTRKAHRASARTSPEDLLPQLSSLYIAGARDVASGTATHLPALAGQFHGQGKVLLEAEALSLLALNASSTAVVDDAVPSRLAAAATAVEGAGGAALRAFAGALFEDEPKALEAAGRSLSADRLFAHAELCYAKAAPAYRARSRAAAARRSDALAERLRSVLGSGTVPPLGWLPGRAGS